MSAATATSASHYLATSQDAQSSTPLPSQPSSRSRGRRPRRARARGESARPTESARPLSGNEIPSDPTSPHALGDSIQSHAHHQGRRGRGRGRGAALSSRNQTRVVDTRQFGGSLTSQGDGPTSSSRSSLHVGAQEFTPGENHVAAPTSHNTESSQPESNSHVRNQHNRRNRRLSKSNAPDIATRIHDDINNGQYECPICTSEVLRKSKVWSCHLCWTVFHLDCIRKWSSKNKIENQPQPAEHLAPKGWRCPGCNLVQEVKPTNYSCWCGKETEPRPVSGLPPHSCGQTCGKPRESPKKCPHPCELLCHAGPCPPCPRMGQTQRCFCGKEEITKRCTETDYDKGWSCGNVCNEAMPCGEHTCSRECHSGLCGACEVRLEARCYCGKEEKDILCCDKNDEKHSTRSYIDEEGTQVSEEWTGMYQCTNICERFFDCQIHKCQKSCHALSNETSRCPRSPALVTHCPCGKTAIDQLSSNPRTSCQDPIPHCKEPCLKELPCGHFCGETCHIDACPPCLQTVAINCRCGRTSVSSVCHQGKEEPPVCGRVCRATLNCGRHECGEHCCSGETKASERVATKRKLRSLDAFQRVTDAFEAEHICTRLCGRVLKCENHTCKELCHRGPCGSCPEAIFDELSCHCGRTVLQPPLPCGTNPPVCRFDCERPKLCGHPQVQHNCHSDNESCPKCPYLVEKDCICGKKTLKNQQCWFTDVRCGQVCGKRLKCGSHACQKLCHKPGDCEDQVGSTACQQTCGKPKKSCGHSCEDPCHAPYPCREEKPCQHKTIITCPCQNIKSEIRCAATKSGPGNKDKILSCTDECARLERNRKLALALEIDPKTHTDDHIPYSGETMNLFQSGDLDPNWLSEIERELRFFAVDDQEKRKRFKPTAALQRSFIHSLSEDFGFDSESMDPEPHRHVAVFKTPRFVSAPLKTLRDCVRIQRNKAIEAYNVAQVRNQEKQEKLQTINSREPYNGYLLTNPRFALTIEELNTEIAVVLGFENPRVSFNIQFTPNGDVALKALPGAHTERTIDAILKESKVPLARNLESEKIGILKLARFDDSLNVVHKEGDNMAEAGWSKVAAKAAAPKTSVAQLSRSANEARNKNGFMVLGNTASKKPTEDRSKVEAAKAKKKNEEVVEDWEAAEIEAEAREGADISVPATSANEAT